MNATHDIESDKQSPQAQSEVMEFLETREQRRRIFPRAALVGALAGLVALAFRVALGLMDTLRYNMIEWAKGSPVLGWLAPTALGALGAFLSILLTRRLAPEAAGSGIPHLEAVLHRLRSLNWQRILPVKFLGGVLAIGGGLTMGREGPTVQMGGAVGEAVSRWLKCSQRERLTLISAGSGAGLAAAFNAPLSGLVFVLEEVRHDFQPIVFGAVFIASVIADVIARIGAGQFPVFTMPAYPVQPLLSLPLFALLGLFCGAAGVLFNKSLLAMLSLYDRTSERQRFILTTITGALIGASAWFYPRLNGSGHQLAELVLTGNIAIWLIPLLFALRFIFTIISYGTGAPGGIFAPLLVLGALLGAGLGYIGREFFPELVSLPAVYAVAGMAALFTAIVRAPLTGIMLIVEMTGNYALMLPLLTACFSSYLAAEAVKDLPIYEALLERDLRIGGEEVHLHDPAVMEFTVSPGSSFDGKRVRDLGLPRGCILIRCLEGKQEFIPQADTVLRAHMRISALVSPESSQGPTLLRQGCRGRRNTPS